MIEQLAGLPAHTLGFTLSGTLHGWDVRALWDDIKLSATHCNKIRRIALVGDKSWEKWMAAVCKPFTLASVRYFDSTELDAAKAWLAAA